MGIMKDIVKLIVLLAVLAAIVIGIHQFGMQEDNKEKYKHPISQPGARW